MTEVFPNLPLRFPALMFLHLFLLFQHQKNQGSALSQREPGSVWIGGSYKVAISVGRNEILDSKILRCQSDSEKNHPRLIRTISRTNFRFSLPKKHIICHFKKRIAAFVREFFLNTGGFGRCWPLFENPFIKKQFPPQKNTTFIYLMGILIIVYDNHHTTG